LSSNYPPRDDEMSEAENVQPHTPQMLRCPECKRDFAEITPNGLRFGRLLIQGIFKIVCGGILENGETCHGRRKWRPAKMSGPVITRVGEDDPPEETGSGLPPDESSTR